MPLTAGTKLGTYEIIAQIGAGGMGEVYRARDTKLERDVAVKVLPEGFAENEERLARFEREAKSLAALNHPNIATIFGFEQEGDVHFLVMELVEGSDLSDRIARGAIPVDEAVPLFIQVAEGLEAAHEKGIVHRDLKPANIMVGGDGRVKILDFGLAKAMEPANAQGEVDMSQSPTMTAAATMRGEIMGTAAYMSPEQASGKEIDRRTDLWAFGVCLYEALVGRRPFDAEDVPNTLAAVLRDEVDLSQLPRSAPRPLRRLLTRCLARDRGQRLRDAGDARLELEAARGAEVPESEEAIAAPRAGARSMWMLASVTGLVGLVVGGLGMNLISGREEGSAEGEAAAVQRFTLASHDRLHHSQAISPDGSAVAYAAPDGLWLRSLDQIAARRLPGSERAATPFWSPDSEWVGFQKDEAVWKVRVPSGDAEKLCDLPPGRVTGASWGEDGTVLLLLTYGGDTSSLLQVPATGGTPQIFFEPNRAAGEQHYTAATHLPGGRGVVVSVAGESTTALQLVLNGVATNLVSLVDVMEPDTVVYSPTGHILHSNRLNYETWAVPFSLERLEVGGEPFLVARDMHSPSLSANATLVYREVDAEPQKLLWVSRSGEILESLGREQEVISSPSSSPDGSLVVFSGRTASVDELDLFIEDIRLSSRQRLTNGQTHFHSTFTPDGASVVYTDAAKVADLMRLARDGSGEPEVVVAGFSDWSADYSSDGRHLVFYRIDADTGRDLWLIDLQGDREPMPYLQTRFDEIHPRFSPDGRHVIYQSNDQGRWNIYVETFPERTQRVQISPEGGEDARWSPLGDEVFFVVGDDLVAAKIRVGDVPEADAPTRLFSGAAIGTDLVPPITGFEWQYDVGPGAERFVVVQGVDHGRSDVVLVRNWHREMESRGSSETQP